LQAIIFLKMSYSDAGHQPLKFSSELPSQITDASRFSVLSHGCILGSLEMDRKCK